MSVDLYVAASWLDMPTGRKAVLQALCERANLVTGLCWPGREEIALRCSMSVRAVTPHLRDLEAAGYLRSGPRPWRELQFQRRWVNVDRILQEGRVRMDWFKAEQERKRLQRRLLADEPPSDDWALAQIALEGLDEEGEEETSLASAGPQQGKFGASSRGSLAREAEEAPRLSNRQEEPSSEPLEPEGSSLCPCTGVQNSDRRIPAPASKTPPTEVSFWCPRCEEGRPYAFFNQRTGAPHCPKCDQVMEERRPAPT